MKITHKILLAVAVPTIFFLEAMGAAAQTGNSACYSNCSLSAGPGDCSAPTPCCAYPDFGAWRIGSGSCQANAPTYTNRSPRANPVESDTRPRITTTDPCDSPTILPTRAPYVWPTALPTTVPTYSNPANIWRGCSGIVKYDEGVRRYVCIPSTSANVFEALWNFITHKRQR